MKGTERLQQPVPAALRTGIWLVPTQRLRRVLLADEWATQCRAGCRVAEMPRIELPENFAASLWERHDHPRPCLPASGDRLFWMDAASDLDEAIDPARAWSLANLAAEAFALECDWEIADGDWGSEVSEDVGQYARLRKRFLERLQAAGFESRQSLLRNLVFEIESGSIDLGAGGPLTFQGFDERTPLELHLAAAWQSRGWVSREIPMAIRSLERASVWAFPDRETELYAAAHFARRSLLENPDQHIGVIVLGLERLRSKVRAIFDDVLAPPRLITQGGIDERPYNLSLGEALGAYPLVGSALDILDRAEATRAPMVLSRLLRSPYWGDPTRDGPSRFAYDCAWRERGRNADAGWDLPNPSGVCPEAFRRAFDQSGVRLAASGIDRAQPLSHWLRLWSGLLTDFGWPGARPLNSADYQSQLAWNETLEEIAGLAALPRIWRFSDFRLLVRKVFGERLFQPETPAAPIEVMGPLETAGLAFDRIWVVGAEAHAWPPEPHPHPFLPFALQRQRGLPHASSMREYQFNERLLTRWRTTSTEIVVSFTRREDDRDLDPSPLLAEWSAPEAGPLGLHGFRHAARMQDSPLETVAFTEAVAMEATDIRGGIRFLGDQAACPFQAFAGHRLRAETLPAWRLPFDPSMRGRLLHAMLDWIGKNVRVHPGQEWDWARIQVAIKDAVDATLAQEPAYGPLARALRQALRPSFIDRLETWFREQEIPHEAAFEILTEQTASLTLSGLRFDCRADRIERLADGALVIVDYKTGVSPNPQEWMGGRPLEPQLPVYALAWPDARALLIACLKPGRMGYTGLAECPEILPHLGRIEPIPDWPGQQQAWRRALEQLAREIQSGRNDLDPHGRAGLPCDRCAFPTLCRLHETRIAEDPEPVQAGYDPGSRDESENPGA